MLKDKPEPAQKSGMSAASWDASNIQAPWFEAHFNHAANVIKDWLLPVISRSDFTDQADSGIRILDFGCGGGITTLSLALQFPEIRLIGVDVARTHDSLAENAKNEIRLNELPENLEFHHIHAGSVLSGRYTVDAVYSWSVFEHIDKALIPGILQDLFSLLPPGGHVFLQIEPLFYSPFGHHLRQYLTEPWAHLLLDEEELSARVMEFAGEVSLAGRGRIFTDMSPMEYKAFRLREYAKLNRCTADEIVRFHEDQGFEIIRQRRNQMQTEIPPSLLEQYPEEQLRTNGLILLARKPD